MCHDVKVSDKLFFVQFKNPERLSGSCFVSTDHAGLVNKMILENVSSKPIWIQKGQCLAVLV